MRRKFVRWLSIGAIVISGSLIVKTRPAEALFGFGEDIPFLIQLIGHAVTQIHELSSIIGSTEETASVLDEMNRGIKEVLHLAETAHVPLPPQVYEQAKRIDQAAEAAHRIYGSLPGTAPKYAQDEYQSGIEGLFLSQDAFDYAKFLDDQGRKIKGSAVAANEAAATKLTAESMGVLLQGVDQTNRLQAKGLEINSTHEIQDAAKDGARQQSFLDTHDSIARDFRSNDFTPLTSFDDDGGGR
jgi:hypothetical protein